MATAALKASSTRDRMIAEARGLFAERGFYGVSIAQIAAELGLTKQALLHHFGTKEKLYGLVLAQIAGELDDLMPQRSEGETPLDHLVRYFEAMVADTPERVELYMLLMREILDNRLRAETAGKWYLKPFLEDLVAMVDSVSEGSEARPGRVLSIVIQLLGAVSYQAVSRPTFRGIFEDAEVDAVQTAFPQQVRTLVVAALKADLSN